MAKEIIINEHYWTCDRYGWGCMKKHKNKAEAELCEATKPGEFISREASFKKYIRVK